MSRDFIGSQTGRSFRQSPNRDRMARTGIPLVDWLAHFRLGGITVLLDGTAVTPTPPQGLVFEDLRQSATNNQTNILFPSLSRIYCRRQDAFSATSGQAYFLVGNPLPPAFVDPSSLASRMPDNSTSGLFRITIRCWGIVPLSNAFDPTSATSFSTRLGFRRDPDNYNPPDYTVYNKNVLLTFNFGFSDLAFPDFPNLSGLPINCFSIIPGPSTAETKSLYLVDRIITATTTIRSSSLVADVAVINAENQFAFPGLEDAILETHFANGTQHLRFQHGNVFFPNGSLLNPASPLHCFNTLTPTGIPEMRTTVFATPSQDTFLFRHAGVLTYVAPFERINAYEPPTLTVLRQELLN